MDNEILQDFLVEAREIIDDLSESLITLENNPEDVELLNAIFRGFHTIKGGAGFLDLTALVDTCHCCENLLDSLRNGAITLNSPIMDAILAGFDNIQRMFGELEDGVELTPTDPNIIEQIEQANENKPLDDISAIETEVDEPEVSLLEQALNSDSEDISEEEFEALLKELHGSDFGASSEGVQPTPKAPTEEVTPTPASAQSSADKEPPKPKSDAKPNSAQNANSVAKAEPTVRVDTQRLDDIMNMVGELVLIRNRLLLLGSNQQETSQESSEQLTQTVANLDLVVGDLQNAVVKTRMQPIKKVFGRFPRLVRDLAKNLKKDVSLSMVGEDTELDKNLVEALADPLIHMVRNSVDHGVELPHVRVESGKDAQGTIILKASQEGDHILLEIQDDGAGMDADKLKQLAIDRGIIDDEQASRMTEEEAFDLIFAAGFSTKSEISDISGRGVGMDVVKTSITQLNGSIRITSTRGEGTLVTIKVPLTLAIQPTMMLKSKEQVFAFPLSCISEIYQLDVNKMNCVGRHLTTTVRGKTVPLIYLDKWIDQLPQNEIVNKGHVVLVHVGSTEVAIVVDDVIGQEEVVIKPLGAFLKQNHGIAGATITSDGGIALIVDITELLNKYVGK